MTYRELGVLIQNLEPDQLDDNATIHLTETDEFYAISDVNTTVGDDVLHDNHFYLEVPA